MSTDLNSAQIAAAFALLGKRPSSGPLSVLPPVDKAAAKALLADTDLTIKNGNLSKAAATMFGVLAAPRRKITSTVVTAITEGAATSTFFAPAEGGPYVAVAETKTGYSVSSIESGAEVAVLVATHLGWAGGPTPLDGDAVELTVGGWAALAALADLDEPASMPGAVRRALGKKPGKVVNVFRTIAPAGAPDPGSTGVGEAANWLSGAGLAIQMHDSKLQSTRQGRAVSRALRQFVVAGSVTVDHLTEAGSIRVVSLSSIRTTERLFFGVWRVDERGPVIALGEPGIDSAATTVRTLIEAPNILPPAKGATVPDESSSSPPSDSTEIPGESSAPSPGSDSPPPPSPPKPPASPTSGERSNPQWLTYLIGGGLMLALVGVGVGLFGGDDSTGSSLAPGQAIVGSGSSSTTTLPASTTTSTAAPVTSVAPVTVPATVESTTTSSSTTTSTSTTTTSTTTTTTLPPSLLEDNFDGSTTALPLFGPGVMTSAVNGDNQLQIEVLTSGVIPVTYPDPLPDGVEISFDFNPQPNASTAAFGVLVLSEDPSDTVIDHWVAVWANPSDGLLTVVPFDADSGGFGPPLSTAISGGFAADQWHTMRLVISGGQVEVHLDGVFITTWSGVTPVTAGYWGPVIAAAAAGDTMLVDNVLVEDL